MVANNRVYDGASTEEEVKAAEILLNLSYLVTRCVSDYRFSCRWSSKKLRSALVSPPLCNAPSSVVKAEASSPNTPLSFSPSECDSKSKLSVKRSKPPPLNLKKKELEEAIRERMLTQQQLKESIDKVKVYLYSLMTENTELKAKQQKLLTTQMEQQQQQTTAVSDQVHAVPSTSTVYHREARLICHQFLPLNSGNDQVHASPSTSKEYHPQGPLIYPYQPHSVNVVAGKSNTSKQLQYHQAVPLINHHGQPVLVKNDPVCASPLSSMQFHYQLPLITNHHQGISINQAEEYDQRCQFDLNRDPEEYTRSYKAMTAEARLRRFHANKGKRTRVKR